MRLISIDVLQEGMVVGRAIWNEAGHPLLQKGVVITPGILRGLRKLNIQYIYIDDKLSEGIEVQELVTPAERNKVVQKITESYKALKGSDIKQATYILDQQTKVISNIVEDLLNTILDNEEMLTVLTDVFLYDEYLYQHSFQVTMYSIAIAKEMGYNYEDLRVIGIGAMLHDVGKLLVPQEILFKPDRLTNEEFEIMKQHTRYGFDILRNLHSVSLIVAHCAFQHHERLDGSGYPRGLKDYEIHPFAKIIGVADVFDAVTSNRVYRSKMLPTDGIKLIDAGSGTIFSAAAVQALKKIIVQYPNGTTLKLKDGRRGVVSRQNASKPERPYVRIFEEDEKLLDVTYEINLVEEILVEIEKIETDYVLLEE